jgi:hypothetical protein
LLVSRFDPVLVEASLSFVALGPLQVSFCLGTTMGKAAGRGCLLGFAPFSSLPLGAKIDDGAHGKVRW